VTSPTPTYYSGRINTVLFSNPAKSFYVFKMMPDGRSETVAVRGQVVGLDIEVGTWFGFEAHWENHPKHGRQLVIDKAPVFKNGWDADTVVQLLISSGVGEGVAHSLKKTFGSNLPQALLDAETLQSSPGISKFTAQLISSKWDSIRAYHETLNFLLKIGVPQGQIRSLWSMYREKAEEVMSRNPWALTRIDGISFEVADEIASRLNIPLDCPERVQGAVLYVNRSQKESGHLYLSSGDILNAVRRYIPGVTPKAIGEALVTASKEKLLVLDRETRPGLTAVYEPWGYRVENECARLLHDRVRTAGVGDPVAYAEALTSLGVVVERKSEDTLKQTVDKVVDGWGKVLGLQLSPDQIRGVRNALIEPVSIINGLPGTGKTASLKVVVKILQAIGEPYLLVAPTGIAAKRLEALTGAKAATIHRAFGAQNVSSDEGREATYEGIVGTGTGAKTDAEGEVWEYGDGNTHTARVIVGDEFSMADQHLLYRILSCTSDKCRLVFVGDAAQLPSVGPGNVLRDLAGSQKFPVVALTQIFRQDHTSGIVPAAHAIVHGEFPKTGCGAEDDFVLLEREGEAEVYNTILGLADRMYRQRIQFQILSPKHDGPVGVTALNAGLRELLNPAAEGLLETRMGRNIVREGDRVMVVKNNYKLGVYNGDIGKVNRINRKTEEIEVKIFGNPVLFVPFKFSEFAVYVRMAFACSIHKSQSQEFDRVIVPLVDSFKHQLQRNLLYTAVTRAKKKVYLVGTKTALARAVENDREDRRNTLFRDRLEKAFQKGTDKDEA